MTLTEFKRRAARCTAFDVENHRFPNRSGPRTVISINTARIQATSPESGTEVTHTAWPKAAMWRIDDNRITFLHDGDGSDCFTFTFPIDD